MVYDPVYSKGAFEWLLAVAPIAISGVVAYFVYQQGSVQREKLRLDLYNRRFEIYTAALEFYWAITSYKKGDAKDESFKAIGQKFIRRFRESKFLFDSSSGVYELLDMMHTKSFLIRAWREEISEMSGPGTFEVVKKSREDAFAADTWFNHGVKELERRLAPYLDFHKNSA